MGRVPASAASPIEFERRPDSYKHWKLSFDGAVATVALEVREDGGLRPQR